MTKIKIRSKPYIVSIAIIGITIPLPFMGEINSFIFMFAFFSAPLFFGIRLFIKTRTEEPNWIVYFIISVILSYALIVLSVWSMGRHYQYELNKYDYNSDGMFSGEEITPEMEKAMDRLTHDTGRTFAPITAAIVSPLYNSFWFVLFTVLKMIIQRVTNREKDTTGNRLSTE